MNSTKKSTSSTKTSSSKSSTKSTTTTKKSNTCSKNNLSVTAKSYSSVDILKMGKFLEENLPFRGPPGGYLKSPGGTKERWYGDDGLPIKDRHNTDHGNPKKHPWVPHDHDWGDEDGKWEPGDGYETPKSSTEDITNAAITVGILYGGYLLVKWGLAVSLTPVTGGGSLVVAGATP